MAAASFFEDCSMGIVTFIERDGNRREVEFRNGDSLMQAGTRAGVDGIIGECGGSCMCATCHVYLTEDEFARLPAPEEMEQEALEFTARNLRPTSRLGCQIKLSAETDALVVEVAEA
jgi:ferredoxin, 2Fe-2S